MIIIVRTDLPHVIVHLEQAPIIRQTEWGNVELAMEPVAAVCI